MNKQVSFEIINGREIFNILTEPENPQNKIVIMSHGFRGTSIGPARTFVDFEQLLLKEGFSSLRFDQACSGNSEGDYINSSFNDWVNTTAYFAKKYLDKDYKVILLGQSMGATTAMIATSKEELRGKIPAIIVWVPDPKSTFDKDANVVYEEGGQRYKGTFWQEARNANFFDCLDNYTGKIHLVYGENDKYISEELRNQVIDKVKQKGQSVMILAGQDHSSWDYDVVQPVYQEELNFLKSGLES
ncbi:MAG TPA: alpha/beta hydrolase [Patescibacteria group bacterium]|nr:alpha/beta hydrolase [Patescibacteria group bacterium]